MVVVKKKREAIPEADNRSGKAMARNWPCREV
jgi:hypothetical protein